MKKLTLLLLLFMFSALIVLASNLKDQALTKMDVLKTLISQARSTGIDVTREETVIWFAQEFLKYADWDQNNVAVNENQFSLFYAYKNNKTELAQSLPDLERQGVLDMINSAISGLNNVVNGKVIRRSVPKVDWANIVTKNDQFECNGNPIFLYDYFSKAQGNPTDDPTLYNDYLGNIDHPGSLNPYFCKSDKTIEDWRLNEILNHPEKNIGYSMLWHSQIPDWLKVEDPKVTDGKSLFIGYDIDNPLMRDVWRVVLNEVVSKIKGKKYNQLGYCLANEPHWFSELGHWTGKLGEMQSISSYTVKKFQNWLLNKYAGNIDKLNRLWGTNFADFNGVTITVPISNTKQGTPVWYDWCRFNMDRGTEWLTFLHDQIKNNDPDAVTHVKIMPDLFSEDSRSHGIDVEAITELTEMIGDDAKTRKRDMRNTSPEDWEANYSFFWAELCQSYDFMESVSPNKIHINSESHFLSTSQYRDLNMTPDYVRSCYWLSTLLGMDANLTWFWGRDPDGSLEQRLESGTGGLGSGYPGSAAQQPEVVNEVTQTMMDLNAFSPEIMALRHQKKAIRIFYSETSAINKNNQMTEAFNLYEALNFNGLPIGYATEKIIKKQDNHDWDMIVVYKTEYVTNSEFDALQSYLNNGGTVLIDDGRSLTKDEYGQQRSISLVSGNGNLFNMGNSAEINSIKNKAISLLSSKGAMPKVSLSEINGLNKKGCIWRVAPNGDNKYLMTIVNLGKNTAKLKTTMAGGLSQSECTNMLTGEILGSEFQLKPEGVLLLSIKASDNPVGINNKDSLSTSSVIGGDDKITITGASGKSVRIVNLSGQTILNTLVQKNKEVFPSPPGVMMVTIGGKSTLKAVVY